MVPWCSCCLCSSLTYLIQLHDERIWRRHIDHLVVTDHKAKQNHFHQGCDDWLYEVGTESYRTLPNNQPIMQEEREGRYRYPTRTHRPLQRLIEQANLQIIM